MLWWFDSGGMSPNFWAGKGRSRTTSSDAGFAGGLKSLVVPFRYEKLLWMSSCRNV